MAIIVDARGLACPEPVIRVKKALEKENEIEALVDNTTALENVRRLAKNSGCDERSERISETEFKILISRKGACSAAAEKITGFTSGPTVAVLSSDTMGRGNDELGGVLMKAFLHTLAEISPAPDMVILYNTGVKLAGNDTQSAADLKSLTQKGASVLVCGTCADFFGIKDSIGAGVISNMYDIVSALAAAGRIICP